jgi:uncharacterized membrane protein YvbJ
MICKTCGTELHDGVRMCPICGTELYDEPPKPTPGTINDPKIFNKTRIISFVIVAIFLIIGLYKVFIK